jgi:transcriptional regulator with XRE-family HTH domain
MATPKDLPEDIGGFIRDLRQTAKISLRQLADKAGVSNPYLSQIERGLRKPSAEVLQQIASALRVSTPAMYLRAGLLDSEGQQGVLAAVAVDPELTIAQKQALSQIYETFRNENARNAPAAEADATVPAEADAETTAEEDALLAAVAQAEADGDLVAAEPAGTGRETATVMRDVAAVEGGAAPAPKTTTT